MDRCGREPTPTNVKKWVDGIGTELGIQLIYSERLHSALTCRYRKYTVTLKSKKGGAGRDAYRSLMWDVPISIADLHIDENFRLQEEVATLKLQIEDLEKNKTAMCIPNTNKRKPLAECSGSQIRKRKKKAIEDFSSSISWMPEEIGLVPLSLQTLKLRTNKREEVQFAIPDEVEMEDVLGKTLMMKDQHMISGLYLHIYCVCTLKIHRVYKYVRIYCQ